MCAALGFLYLTQSRQRQEIDRRTKLTKQEFFDKHYLTGRPVIVTDAFDLELFAITPEFVRNHYSRHALENRSHIVEVREESTDYRSYLDREDTTGVSSFQLGEFISPLCRCVYFWLTVVNCVSDTPPSSGGHISYSMKLDTGLPNLPRFSSVFVCECPVPIGSLPSGSYTPTVYWGGPGCGAQRHIDNGACMASYQVNAHIENGVGC